MAVLVALVQAGEVEVGVLVDCLSGAERVLRRPDQTNLPAHLTDAFLSEGHLLIGLATPPPTTKHPPLHDAQVYRIKEDLSGPAEALGSWHDFDGWPELVKRSDPTEPIAYRSGFGDLVPVDDELGRFRGGLHLSETRSLLEVIDTTDGTIYELSLPFPAHHAAGDGVGRFLAAGEDQAAMANVVTGEVESIPGLPSGFQPIRLLTEANLDNLPAELVATDDAISGVMAFQSDTARADARPAPAHRDAGSMPSLRLVAAETSAGRSRLGGQPELAEGMSWPTVNGAPLPFLGQIDLAEAQAVMPLPHLPADGLLSVFYCPNLDPFEEIIGPEALELLWAADMTGRLIHIPNGPLVATQWPDAIPSVFRPSARPFTFAIEHTQQTLGFDINSPDRPEPPGGYQRWAEAKREYEATLLPGPLHRIGGHADYVQPTELGDLIIQLDGDREFGWEWGDGGRLHVTVCRLDDLKPDFSNVDFYEASH